MRWVIGIDGGGTKTSGSLADASGRITARAVGESTNPYLNPPEVVEANFRAIAHELMSRSGVDAETIDGVCLGLSGCDRPGDRAPLEAMVKRVFPQARAVATNDALVALVGGCGELNGVMVISGTGSIAYGFTRDGRSARAGGYGQWLGDEGSGFTIAHRGLIAVMRAADGREPPTAIRERVLSHLSIAEPMGLMPWMREHGPDKAAVAALAPLVIAAAEQGDPAALDILRWAAKELALAAAAVARKLWPDGENFPVVVGGSNLRRVPFLYDRFKAEMASQNPAATVMQPRAEPADGACFYLLQLRD